MWPFNKKKKENALVARRGNGFVTPDRPAPPRPAQIATYHSYAPVDNWVDPMDIVTPILMMEMLNDQSVQDNTPSYVPDCPCHSTQQDYNDTPADTRVDSEPSFDSSPSYDSGSSDCGGCDCGGGD